MAQQRDGSRSLLADPISYARSLQRVRDAVLSGRERTPTVPRPRQMISESWHRSLAAHIDPDHGEPPVVYDLDEIRDLRADHPLADVVALLRNTLLDTADEAMHVMIITDARGHILWREGNARVCLRADAVALAEGTRWNEGSIGTNAMGTALATGEPVQIYSAEHLVSTYHNWTCAAAPLRDPDTGKVLGVVDISGPLRTVHPAMVSLVKAAVALAEGQLRVTMSLRDERLRARNMSHLAGHTGALLGPSGRVLAAQPHGMALPATVDVSLPEAALPDGSTGRIEPLDEGYLLLIGHGARTAQRARLRLLGSGTPYVVVNGRRLPLSQRHAEILTLLALYPDGLSGEQLRTHLHGDGGNPVTVRAEIHRLRQQLGEHVLSCRPYRLAAQVEADFLTVRSALDAGQPARAVSAYTGELLPKSESPTVRAEREELFAALRNSVIATRDADTLWAFYRGCEQAKEDLELLDVLDTAFTAQDPRRAIARAHAQRVDRA
jgi:hypothetical protein